MSSHEKSPYFEDPFQETPVEPSSLNIEVNPIDAGEEDWQWAMFTHLAGFVGYVVPFGSLIGPIVVWSMKKDSMPLVDTHGKRAINFHLTLAILLLISIPLIFVVIGIFMLFAVLAIQFIFTLLATIAVSQRKDYTYPFSFKFLK